MSVQDIIRAWKADEDDDKDDKDDKDEQAPENPAGEQELSDAELEQIVGGTGGDTCMSACINACQLD